MNTDVGPAARQSRACVFAITTTRYDKTACMGRNLNVVKRQAKGYVPSGISVQYPPALNYHAPGAWHSGLLVSFSSFAARPLYCNPVSRRGCVGKWANPNA